MNDSVSEGETPVIGQPRHTDPKTIWVGAASGLQNAILPAAFIMYSSGGFGILIAAPAFFAIIAVSALFSYIAWKRLTYTIGETDIRVESGVLSRSARSVPYERIQDVSLEQKFIPRLFGLAAVKFETGAGGGEDLALSYLTEEAGEELRQLVRARRDGEAAPAAVSDDGQTASDPEQIEAEALFEMGPRRLFTFGLFEFSLAVFAVLAGLFQYADTFIDYDALDFNALVGWVTDRGDELGAASRTAQWIGAIGGIITIFVIGSLTGMVRVFTREWGFLLERTARGFRRRRGLFTRTDVVMPIHRVQGVKIGTRALRYRFGWHSLSFVSLAQDMGASNHVVAPFAKMDEIAPIVETAGFRLPGEDTDWHRSSVVYLLVGAIVDALIMIGLAIGAYVATSIFAPEWTVLATSVPLILGALISIGTLLSWRFRRHALDDTQLMATKGVLSPSSQIATRLKLHSVEISRGPFARLFGYATLHLGQAGGTFSIAGVPIERAREVRSRVMETIAATDFSQLESQTS